jgi:hypothetical protein
MNDVKTYTLTRGEKREQQSFLMIRCTGETETIPPFLFLDPKK